MNTSRFVALIAALLLTAAEFVILDYDARRHLADDRTDVAAFVASRR